MPTKTPAMPDSKLEHNIAFQMASIIYRLDQDLRDTILRKLDLTYVHFRVLQYLYEKDGQKIGDIATAIVVRQPVLSRVIDQMEERALVKRRADPSDNRLMRVYLSAKGKARYKEAWPPAHAMIDDSLRNFDQQEQDTLLRLLSKMAGNIFN
ncbi:MAG TPA: MarR family transcriptional regulator [Eoetvoesiella sp.]|jgi:DNA-binding MarR family transcriptional regulator|uniref:MarR family winged helix-turn-helix transcriptional regulator n=1 Tax=Eoetvoesiella sp. TaxID=1966355 RepID=UPI002CD0A611|nr:MarR family transcriptional regulator [Eoetvoesiella sp.]HWK61780.1 MarR family transcriptional regulator [Eoetvoesiella sp.]